jgi:predicted dehydrogenase
VLDLAYLYDAFAKARADGNYKAPDFADALRLHKLIDLISEASAAGTRQTADFWPAG